ncbi:TonB-dependent siderophore receptor [Microbulbifer halophilus]|uniref:TonB-dependent siderophore receptor n=1 Tax=Microbulbifer halophilus TaxID=453963 RepID=A0ABW5EED1_9GAMM|nr:TonB-dependent siderophore receptor [Microbulbifer halophilus]MCW8125759.1 TonB-dependent siderophore receptor [Microbulbifer halophilus]
MSARFCTLATAVALASGALPALAADEKTHKGPEQSQQAIETVTVTGKYTVDESIDTATGLGLTLRETPQSVTVLTAERIKDQNLSNIVETVNNAVGISSSQLDNVRNSLQSRGFDISNYQIDGVPLSWSLAGDSGETSADVSIYERVEFVRGATGLLTGVGDPSASINLVRKKADHTDLAGYMDVDLGRWGKTQTTADIAGGLNESGTVRARMVARYLDSESHLDNFSEQQNVFYGVIEGDLTPNTLLRVGGHYQNRNPRGATWGALPALYSDGTATDWDVSRTTGLDWTRWETTSENHFASINHVFDNGWDLKINYNHLAYDKASRLVLLSGALDKETGEGLYAQRYRSSGATEQDSYDLQLKGDYQLFGRQHEFVTGALHSEQRGDTSTRDPDPLGGNTGWDSVAVGNYYQWGDLPEPDWTEAATVRDDNETSQTGYYASTRLSLSDHLKVIAGGRVASWDRRRTYYGDVSNYGDDDVVIPYFGALYDLTAGHRVYASYTEIFTPQNNKDASGDYLDPLTGTNTEVGLKSRFLNDRLQTSIALFRVEQDNLAVADPEFVPTPEQDSAYYAAQGTVSDGFEAEVIGRIGNGWDISAGYSRFEAEDAQGREVNTTSPRRQFKLFTTYQFVDSLPALSVGGGVNWQSGFYAEGSGNHLEQDAFSLVNLMARYDLSSNMYLQMNVENALDETYYNYLNAGYYNQYNYGKPRNATLRFSYNF